jgi:hypothetical protein
MGHEHPVAIGTVDAADEVWKRADVIIWAKAHGRTIEDDSPEAPAEDPGRAAIRKLPPMR